MPFLSEISYTMPVFLLLRILADITNLFSFLYLFSMVSQNAESYNLSESKTAP